MIKIKYSLADSKQKTLYLREDSQIPVPVDSNQINKYQCWFNVTNSTSDSVIDQFKLKVWKVIESSLKLPALGFVSFLAETYSYMNKPENKNINETKGHRIRFLLKYCSLSFFSFYF